MASQILKIWIEDPSRTDRLLFEPTHNRVRIGVLRITSSGSKRRWLPGTRPC